MANMNETPATQEDVRRAFQDLISVLSPEERLKMQQNKSFVRQLDTSRRAALLAHIETPEVLERRRQMQDLTGRITPSR